MNLKYPSLRVGGQLVFFRAQGWPLHQAKKKADEAATPKGFNLVGLLVNQHPGTAGLPFIESSELEFREPMEPMPDWQQLQAAGMVAFGTREVTQDLFCDRQFAVFDRNQASCGERISNPTRP